MHPSDGCISVDVTGNRLISMRNVNKFVAISLAAVALGVGACGGNKTVSGSAAAPTTTAPTLLPTPTGPTVVDIARAGAKNVSVDFATLDGLAHKHYEILEPFEKKMIRFTGVELSTVL